MSKNDNGKRFLKVMCLIGAFVMCLTGCGKEQEKPMASIEVLLTSDEANYKTVQTRLGDYQKVSTGNASAIYLVHSNLYWEYSAACFTECLVKPRQKVKQGDELMRFETEEDRLQLETLRIQLERKKDAFEEEKAKMLEELYAAKEKAKMLEELYAAKEKAKELKKEDLTIAQLKIEKLQARYEQFLYEHDKEVRRIEQQIAELKEEGKANVLTAPYDGVIEDVAGLYEGDQVYNGQWLVKMYSTDRLLLKADRAADKLRYNMDVMVETGKGDTLKTYQGKVIAAPNILPLSLSQDLILIELDGEIEEAQLKVGFRFRGISEDVQEILMVERGAIQQEDGKEYVYVLDGDMIQKRYVETALSASDAVWILDGLEEGQTLIVD